MTFATQFAYSGDVLLIAAAIGSFFAGKKKGRSEAQAETIVTLESLVDALKGKVEFLEGQNTQKDLLIEKQSVWIEYLRGMVLGGGPQLVPPGALPDLHGSGRRSSPTNSPSGGNGPV